jgi:hypothetical protein
MTRGCTRAGVRPVVATWGGLDIEVSGRLRVRATEAAAHSTNAIL